MIEIDGYADIERIGQGGLGDVYRAQRESTGAVVAIKVLRDVSDESVAWHRTRRELTALVALAGHANVVQLLEVLDLPDGPALVMEYAPGGSVAELMGRRDEPLSVGETVLVGRQTAAALTAAHAQGIVHRDVKPQNLLIDAYGQVKLCDFGIAAMARSEEFQVRTSAISMRYASPEDLDDAVEVGPASDVYSLGATMLHMARGAPPTLKERLAPWEPPTTDDAELAALDRIVAACLHPTPALRPAAADVVDELERLGWSIDERNRSLAFDPGPLSVGDEAPTDRRGPVAEPATAAEALEQPPVARVDAETGSQEASDSPADPPPGPDEVDTVYRGDRRPRPELSIPTAPVAGPKWPNIVAAIIVVVAVVGLVVVFAGGDDVGDPTGVEIVDRPEEFPPVTDLDWPFGEVGECLVQVEGNRLTSIDCAQPHDLQRVALGELDELTFPADSPYERDRVSDAVEAKCDDAYASFVGDVSLDDEIGLAFSIPPAALWDIDRSYQCMLGVADQRLVGSAQATP